MSETKAVSQGLADAFADAFAKGGGTVTVQQTVPDGATDLRRLPRRGRLRTTRSRLLRR